VPRRRPTDVRELRARLQAAEEALRALRAGEVDALVVTEAGDEHVVTLQGADLPYRILLDQMYAGAVTLTPDGVIVYCNRRFADFVRTPLARVIGSALSRFVQPAEQPALAALVERASKERVRGELAGRAGDGTPVPISVTFAPLQLDGKAAVNGVIGVVVDDTERKQQEDLRNRLVQQAMTAQEEERRRIARELHDETGQSLTALLVGLRTIEGSRTMVEAAELAQRLRGIVAQTLDEVGRLSRGLHPSILDDVGLAAAVTRHVQELAQLHGVAVDVRIEGLDAAPLPPLVQTTVYRALQEALTNVARHAGAGSVSVRLVRDEATVELRVQDDGIGFEPGDGGRLGLRGMRERAALLGGSVEVESHPGAGTAITARFPVRGA
jgi:PAS domain S-box-containing protein